MDPLVAQLFGRRRRPDDNRTDNYQRQDVYTSESKILDIKRAERESLIRQSERLCAENRRFTNAVLERLGISTQQDPVPPPQPPAGYRRRPESSVRGRRLKPVEHGTFLNLETAKTQRHQRSLESLDEGVDELYLSHWSSISSLDSRTPDELRAIPLIESPVEVSPPQTPVTPSPPPPRPPRPGRRLSRLPVMMTYIGGADKEVCGYRLQTAQGKVEEIQRRVENLHGNAIHHSPQPPKELRRKPAVRSEGLKTKRRLTEQYKNTRMNSHERREEPVKNDHVQDPEFTPVPVVTPVKPAPPPNCAPQKKTGPRRGTTLKPAKTNNGGKKKDSTHQTADSQDVEVLPRLSNPIEGLSTCFKLINTEDWEKKTEGLRTIRVLAQNHPDTLMVKLHEVCLVLIEEVKNLRSSVACAAMDALRYLYIYLQKDMDPQVDRTGMALLLKIAQSAANVFIQQQANIALEAMVLNCSSGRVLNPLLNTGLSHKCAAVRASAAQQLRLLADRLGADSILTAGKSSAQRFLKAVSKMSLDAAAEVRPHGHAILQQLALHEDFNDLWRDIIADKDRRMLEKILRAAKPVIGEENTKSRQ